MYPLRVDPIFFSSPDDFRAWLAANHDTAGEVLVGFHKRATGRPTLTWPESVDQALCFGWIDGVRRSIDGASYTIRFTPRKKSSRWSAVNIKRAQELTALGLMHEAGVKAFNERRQERSNLYSYENRDRGLSPEYEARFKENPNAWHFFQSQPPGYRKLVAFWVMDAKREETRLRRLATLIENSKSARRIDLLRPGAGAL